MADTFLSKREQAVLEVLDRYGIATNKSLHSTVLAGRSLNAVSKVTARMRRQQLLTRFELMRPEQYFRYGSRAVQLMGASVRSEQPLGPQALPVAYATLVYATQGDRRRRRLTKAEIATAMPWLPSDLMRSPYTIDEKGRLELIRVDLGGSPRHVSRKVTAAIHGCLNLPEMQEVAAQSLFQVAVLTTTRQKARLIAAAMKDSDTTGLVQLNLAVIPQLSQLLLCSR